MRHTLNVFSHGSLPLWEHFVQQVFDETSFDKCIFTTFSLLQMTKICIFVFKTSIISNPKGLLSHDFPISDFTDNFCLMRNSHFPVSSSPFPFNFLSSLSSQFSLLTCLGTNYSVLVLPKVPSLNVLCLSDVFPVASLDTTLTLTLQIFLSFKNLRYNWPTPCVSSKYTA